LKGGVTFAPGVAGQAFRLDGATRYVEVPHSDDWGFGSRDFSIELWVQFRAVQTDARFVGCDEGPEDHNKWFFACEGGCLHFHINRPRRGGFSLAKTPFSPALDQWYHLALTRSRSTFSIYVNGAPGASQNVTVVIPNPDAPLTIGQAEGGFFFNGLIDEVAIYDRALSPAEVKDRWSALAPATKPAAEKVGQVRQFNGHTNWVTALAFFKDGRRFVSCGTDGTIRIWEVATGKELARLEGGHNHPDIDGIGLSSDQRHLLSGGYDNTLRLWDIKTGKQLHSFTHQNRVPGMAFVPDSQLALSGSHDRTVRLWDLKDYKEVHRFDGHTGCVVTVAISSNGHRAASVSEDGTVRLWDLEKRREIACLRGHTGGVYGVAFSPDGKRVLSGGMDKTLRLWDVENGKQLQVFEGHTEWVRDVAFSPDGRRALSASGDGTVRLWEVNTGKELHCFVGHRGEVRCVAFSPDGRSALSCGVDSTIRLWRLPDPPAAEKVGEIRRFGAKGIGGGRLVPSPDGQRLLASAGDGSARYWDIATGKEIYRLPSNGGQVYGVAISPDGTKLLTCSGDPNVIHVYDAATGKEVKQLKGHTDEVTGVAISPDGRMVASSGYDCELRLWNLDTGELIASPGNAVRGQGAAFSPDGKLIATWAQDHMVRLWDVKDLKEVRCLEGHKELVNAGAFSRDGSRLLTGTWPSDGNGPVARPSDLKLWDVKTGKLLRTIDVVPGNVHSLAISPDGRHAVSSGTAGLVQLWDLEKGKAILALTGHVGPANGVAFLPDGRTAVSAGDDSTIRLWRLPDLPAAKENP
jgi:WD40 repeat protein